MVDTVDALVRWRLAFTRRLHPCGCRGQEKYNGFPNAFAQLINSWGLRKSAKYVLVSGIRQETWLSRGCAATPG